MYGHVISRSSRHSARSAYLHVYRDLYGLCSWRTTPSKPNTLFAFRQYSVASSTKPLNDISEHEEKRIDVGGLDSDFSIAIEENGVVISNANTCESPKHVGVNRNDFTGKMDMSIGSWSFSSALLWVNDPQYVHASSGQRLRTLGHYSKNFAIISAEIFCMNSDESLVRDSKIKLEKHSSRRNMYPIPVPGSMHSRGGIYRTAFDDFLEPTIEGRRTLVRLNWNYGEESIFDLDWLVDQARNNCLGRSISIYQKFTETNIRNDKGLTMNGSIRNGPEKGTTTRTTKVSKEIAIGRMCKPSCVSISNFDYEDMMESEDTLFEGMQEIFEHGAILVQNAPNIEEAVAYDEESPTTLLESIVGNLGRRLSGGALSHGSLYGDVFHVKSKNDAENIAYTNVALPPHQDLAYYESKPFLQLLHCVRSANDSIGDLSSSFGTKMSSDSIKTGINLGGESILIDGMAAAEELRRVAPDLFDVLCQTNATFVKERHDADMVCPKPHIVLDPVHSQVVEFNWSPPFEGPLELHPRIDVNEYVRAYQAIECMLDDNLDASDGCISDRHCSTFLPQHLENSLRDHAKEYTWEYALQKGDILVFNNQRMLHGRRSFSSVGNVERHLIGCYTDAMDTVSRYRKLLRERNEKGGGGYGKRNPGSGYRWM